MKLKAGMTLKLFALLGFVCYIQAVVVGPQQHLQNNNRNGYRYNGPAHKYLPAEESHNGSSNSDADRQHQEQNHRQQGYNGPYNTQHYGGGQQQQQQHQHGQQDESWQSVFPQQQHQSLGHQQHHENSGSYQQHQGLGPQQGHQSSSQEQYYQSSSQEQHHLASNKEQHHLGSNQEQHHLGSTQELYKHQSSSHQLNEHSYEPAYSQQQHQQQQQQQQQQQHYQNVGHQQQQQHQQSWNSVHQQHERQEIEPWQSSQQYQPQQQQQQQQQQQHYNRFEQHLPLRGDLWQPINELDLEKLPSAEAHANSHKTIASPGLVPSYTLSSDSEHDRFIGLDALDTRLLTQSLPDAYRKQIFSSPSAPKQQQHEQQLAGSPNESFHGGSPSASDYLQMQSHSYQLPSTHSIHREWPQNEEQQQQRQHQQYSNGNRQYSDSAYAVAPPYLHSSSQPSQSSKNSLTHPSRDFQPPYYEATKIQIPTHSTSLRDLAAIRSLSIVTKPYSQVPTSTFAFRRKSIGSEKQNYFIF
ncbi:putative mediator of RNA polymerase II transcription subunit 26 [Drosophila elegans]|uniref:putative mediator of RNA polymerase II transcription subunit 26 n=1 Tax=Drosophila elegans TaxID=30023 RepID=UPI0007E6D03B|nr:putative mediator of RNA polymerase II transcription subunit 26 [Drosophila elegans]